MSFADRYLDRQSKVCWLDDANYSRFILDSEAAQTELWTKVEGDIQCRCDDLIIANQNDSMIVESVETSRNESMGTHSLNLTKILIVDDDQPTLDLIALLLGERYQVVFESSGAHAVRTAEVERPDLILLDLNMPHVDGREVLRQLKTHAALASTPVICISAETAEQTKDLSMALNADGLIRKPIQRKSFANDLQAVINTLNSVIESVDLAQSFRIAYRVRERFKLIDTQIRREIEAGRTLVFWSSTSGQEWCSRFPEMAEWVRNNQVVFLEMKPTLAAKVEFMDDFTAVTRDLRKIAPLTGAETLIVEEPETIFGLSTYSSASPKISAFGRTLRGSFGRVLYFSQRPLDRQLRQNLISIARSLVAG